MKIIILFISCLFVSVIMAFSARYICRKMKGWAWFFSSVVVISIVSAILYITAYFLYF
jgi:hypothetical protein